MTDTERLLVIEDIKRVKSRYFYYLDHQDWAGWKREVFAPDATMFPPIADAKPLVGVDAIIEWVSERCTGQLSIHHGHMPDIEILSNDSAQVVWAMEDILFKPPEVAQRLGFSYIHGFGHYHETYTRGPAGWRIQTTRLIRLHVEMDNRPTAEILARLRQSGS